MPFSPINKIILIQPPFTQLSAPYPAPYYLKAFLEKRGHSVTVLDHSIGLFERIFCPEGLKRIFADAGAQCGNRRRDFAKPGISRIVERFFSEEDLWLLSIARLTGFLRGQDPEWGHFLALANGGVPGGPRFDAALKSLGGEATSSDAPLLATMLLADLADFITVTLDPSFSLIKYTPRADNASLGFCDFNKLRDSLNNYIMTKFYRPYLEEEWDKLISGSPPGSGAPFVLGLTIPFPGCLSGALLCAASAKERFGGQVLTIAGGGYVNTELRFTQNKEIFTFFDKLSLDRGYGFLASLVEGKPAEGIDDEAAKTIFPDYTCVDFSRYICPVDDVNPMHRLWSEGRWLKAYLAHGCYWHACAFCDVSLDYICNYIPVNPESFFMHMKAQTEQTGMRGIHLVDEAAPPSSLLRLALLNREHGLPFNFWGNIRFEKSFDPDAAAILAAGGLTGVSAGIEVATESGLKRLNKGLTLAEIAGACAAFKEAGILTHGYLIFGFYDQDEGEIINSAEIARQFFEEGLLDSAFWHKFILTRHSRLYAEKQKGLYPELHVLGDREDPDRFALNDLSFDGESRFDKYGEGLDRLLASWMAGDTKTPVAEAFSFKVKKPSVHPETVLGLLDEYARKRDAGRAAIPGAEKNKKRYALFLGSRPVLQNEKGAYCLFWRWRLGDIFFHCKNNDEAQNLAALLEESSRAGGIEERAFYFRFKEILENGAVPGLKVRTSFSNFSDGSNKTLPDFSALPQKWNFLRNSGLAVY
ncbi:MAG: radical SAM protein [Treponema sp.]|nr:radical SAM protein [Treponema sp.]